MKLLAFVDVHANTTALKHLERVIKKQKPDLLVCAGDISVFEHGLEQTLKKLAAFNVPLLILHGNHESEELFKKLCNKYKHVFFIHKRIHEFAGFAFVGYGGGGFSFVEPAFERFIHTHKKQLRGKKIILVTHAPPYNTAVDDLYHGARMTNKSLKKFIVSTFYNNHVGCKSFRKFIITHHPLISISGHIHETAGAEGTLGKTRIINPGPLGKIITI